jgi:hypothetical protein
VLLVGMVKWSPPLTPSDIRYDREAMRAVPYGLGWSSSCVLVGWEMVCPCDRGQLFSLCLGDFFG